MEFEWDEDKRESNLNKHKIAFEDARSIFDSRQVFVVKSLYELEERFQTTGNLDDGRFATVIWTWRGDVIRIISARRSHDSEERAHRALYKS